MKKQTITVNFEYLTKKISEEIELDLTFRNLHSLINEYCIEVTGMDKEHVLFDDVKRMFPNNEIIDLTITQGYNRLEGLSDKEKDLIYKIIHKLVDLKEVYKNRIPF